MKLLLLTLTLLSTQVFAGFEKVTIKNLDFNYTIPYGQGTVEKVGIGVSSFVEVPYDIQIQRTEESFELTTPYVDFSWLNPLQFFHNIYAFETKKLSAGLGTPKTHFVEADYLSAKMKKESEEVKAWMVKGKCEGSSTGEFETRLLDDCRTFMDLTIKKVEVPFDLKWLTADLPPVNDEMDMPADNVIMKVKEGEFYLQLYIKFVFYAGLRTWGTIQYENNHSTIAIKVSEIKFGYLPVTGLVMKKLKETIKSPNVKIDPPWIRINYGAIMHGE